MDQPLAVVAEYGRDVAQLMSTPPAQVSALAAWPGMTPQHTFPVQVQTVHDENGWAVMVDGRRAVVVPTESIAVQIAEELAGWLRRNERTNRA